MEKLQVTLSETMKAFVDERVSEGAYQSANDYILALIQADQRRKSGLRLDGLLQEGLDSGDGIEATAEYWEQKRRELVEQASGTERR